MVTTALLTCVCRAVTMGDAERENVTHVTGGVKGGSGWRGAGAGGGGASPAGLGASHWPKVERGDSDNASRRCHDAVQRPCFLFFLT